MGYCEDYPCCGHTPQDPCERQWYDEPDAFDVTKNPHALCDHENGECNVDYDDDVDYCKGCGEPDDECVCREIDADELEEDDKYPNNLPIHKTEANYGVVCSTCDGGGCLDCTDPA